MSLQQRQYFSALILTAAVIFAVYVAIPREPGITRQMEQANLRGNLIADVIDFLNRIEIVHVLAHVVVFGGVAFLLGDWEWRGERGSTMLAIRYVMRGAIMMEALQILVGAWDDTVWEVVRGVSFDLFVDLLSLGIGILLAGIADYLQRYRTSIP